MWKLLYLLIFFTSFIAVLLFTFLIRKIALNLQFIDHPAERKFHKKPTPLMGGVSIFIGFWATLLIGLFIIRFFPSFIPEDVRAYAEGVWMRIPWIITIFAGSLAVGCLGLWDDKFIISPKQKLLFQFIVALFTVICGVHAKLFLPELVSWIISIVWILVIINAFNLIDNMDGVSAGIAFIVSFLLFIVSLIVKNYFIAITLSAFMGSLLGFLFFNFPPASIFMGDCGSMFIGYMVSVITILGTYYKAETPTYFSVVIPVLVLLVPLFDVISVIVIRIISKKPVFHPDKNHFSHRLVSIGMDVKTAVLFLYLVTFCVGLPSTLLPVLSLNGVLIVFSQAVGVIIIIAMLEYYGTFQNKNHRDH